MRNSNILKKIVLFLCILSSSGQLMAQQESIYLNSHETGNPDHLARKNVQLQNGYRFTGQPNEKMRARIDNTIPGESQYSSLYDATSFNRTVNTNLEVGFTPGQHAVTPTGAANYTIPIQVPSGTNGMEPSISLVYNSQSGAGIAGVGWNLSCLSAITRGQKVIYLNSKVEPVTLSNNDYFHLDGNRLMPKVGSNGVSGTTYGTEIETFSKITSYGYFAGGPEWFKVETKDGKTLEYGNGGDSQFLGEGPNDPVVMWLLKKITDAHGNYILFEYITENNEIRLNKILYTGNGYTSNAPYQQVQFFYNHRSDKNEVFVYGTSLKSNYLLDRIEVKSESKIYREYRLSYGLNQYQHSYLKEIQEFAKNNVALNSTVFKYEVAGPEFNTTHISMNHLTQSSHFVADINGDGISDVLEAAFFNPTIPNFKEFHVHINNLGGNFSKTQHIVSPTEKEYVEREDFKNHTRFLNADFDGNGKEDFLFTEIQSGNPSTVSSMQIYKSYGNNMLSGPSTYLPVSPFNEVSPSGHFIFIGDFNGDDATDFLTVLRAPIGSKASMYFPKYGYSPYNVANPSNGSLTLDVTFGDQVHVIDFDGDGKDELMAVIQSTTRIYSFTSNGGDIQANIIYLNGYPTEFHEVYLGDFNGDAKTDLLTVNTDNYWEVSYSNGKTGFEPHPFQFNQNVATADRIIIGDYNGDGKSDILHANKPTSGSTGFHVYYSKGNSFKYWNTTYNDMLNFNRLVLGDFNGDGKHDLLQTFQTPFEILSFNKDGKDHLLHKITDGFNRTIEFKYDWLTRGTNYTKGSGEIYPINDIQQPIAVVSEVHVPDGINGTKYTGYQYEGATIHKMGRGFLGFKKITVSAHETGGGVKTISESTNSQTLNGQTVHIPTIQKITTRSLADNSLISEKTFTNSLVDQGNSRIWQRTNVTTSHNALTNSATYDAFSYDAYGNITQLTHILSGGSTVDINNPADWIETSLLQYQYGQYYSWVPASLTSATTTQTRYSSGSAPDAFSRTTTYDYFSNGNLKEELRDPTLPNAVKTDFTYNTFGLLWTTTVSTPNDPSLPSRNGTIEYDNKGRLVIKNINTLNQESIYSYSDRTWGKPTGITSIDGLSTTFEYDNFGRLKKTTDPLGVSATKAYGWDIAILWGPVFSPTTYYVETVQAGSPYTKSWFDIYGRETRSEMFAFEGKIEKQYEYDQRGNLKKETLPHLGLSAWKTVTYDYDKYNRPTSVKDNNGTTTKSYGYSPGFGNYVIQESNAASQNKWTRIDAAWRVISVNDGGPDLNYTYYGSGLQKNVRSGSNISGPLVAQMEYDDYGRQTKLIEPNSGTTLYTYDAYGQLVYQKDANLHEYEAEYDVLGRMTSSTVSNTSGPVRTTTYQYVTSGNGINQLKKETVTENTSSTNTTEYTYDTYSRLTQLKESIDNEVFTTAYEYDQYSNASAITYPSGLKIHYNYNSSGYLTTVQNDDPTPIDLFTTDEHNEFGQYERFTLGNGIQTYMGYNADYGVMTNIAAGSALHMGFQYDWTTMNCSTRSNGFGPAMPYEDFTYDGLNRLTNAQLNVNSQAIDHEVTYDYNGNILSKHDAGLYYTYHSSKINAVERVTNPSAVMVPDQVPTQDITYTAFDRTESISEDDYDIFFTYGPDLNRRKSELQYQGNTQYTKYYSASEYEKIIDGSNTTEVHYISCDAGLIAMYVIENGTGSYYYTYTDHLGSIVALTNGSGNVVARQSFDAWGRKRNPDDWTYSNIPSVPSWLTRGFTGHEHLPEFNLINMNNRMYDPIVGRMLAVDNYVQDNTNSQGYNRYTYAMNNPLKYVDPDGEFIFTAAALIAAPFTGGASLALLPYTIGADIGMWQGGSLANGTMNPLKWDYSSGKTWGYMAAGAGVGAASGGAANAVATSGMVGANTAAIMIGSSINSLGTAMYTGGQTDVSVSFGFGSYNLTTGEFGYLGKKGNSAIATIGYSFGGLANVSDVLAGFNPGEVELQTENLSDANGKDLIGHTQLNDNGDVLIDFGPTGDWAKFEPGRNNWIENASDGRYKLVSELPGNRFDPITIKGVNLNRLRRISARLNDNPGNYQVLTRSCSSVASRALTISGVPSIGLHPYLLHGQMYLRSLGVRPSMFSYFAY